MKRKDLGIVKPKIFRHEADLALESGKSLNTFELIYETYGELNQFKRIKGFTTLKS